MNSLPRSIAFALLAAAVVPALEATPASGAVFATQRVLPADPKLGPLDFNGGFTRNHVPESGSPAIDAIPATVDPAVSCVGERDQRDALRPVGRGQCDIGAIEFQQLGEPPPN